MCIPGSVQRSCQHVTFVRCWVELRQSDPGLACSINSPFFMHEFRCAESPELIKGLI